MLKLTNLLYNDAFSSISSALNEWTGKIQGITLSIAVFCLVIVGVLFFFGEESSRKAKKWLIYIIIGCVIVWGAATFGSTIKGVTSSF